MVDTAVQCVVDTAVSSHGVVRARQGHLDLLAHRRVAVRVARQPGTAAQRDRGAAHTGHHRRHMEVSAGTRRVLHRGEGRLGLQTAHLEAPREQVAQLAPSEAVPHHVACGRHPPRVGRLVEEPEQWRMHPRRHVLHPPDAPRRHRRRCGARGRPPVGSVVHGEKAAGVGVRARRSGESARLVDRCRHRLLHEHMHTSLRREQQD